MPEHNTITVSLPEGFTASSSEERQAHLVNMMKIISRELENKYSVTAVEFIAALANSTGLFAGFCVRGATVNALCDILSLVMDAFVKGQARLDSETVPSPEDFY